ncbi:MAG: TonB family protein [Deltaproteobacteria bacterium]|nr:TonB family protein [Deltaproteobacteria bacterium]
MLHRQKRPSRTGRFIGLALLLHLNGALVIAAILALHPEGCAPLPSSFGPIEVALVPPAEVARQAEKKLQEEAKKEEERDKDKTGQVVDLPRPAEERRPDKARFLSEYDTKVEKQTKGKPQPFKPGRVIAARPMRPTPQATPREQQRVERKLMNLAMRRRVETPRTTLPKADDGREQQPQPLVKVPERQGPEDRRGARQAPAKQLTLRDLQLSPAELARALGSRVNDALRDVDEGEQTLLNSKRWRFASFFNRVKRQVAQNWHPDRAYRRRDPRGNVYGFRDRLTVLRVRLTPNGAVKDIHVERASGVGFLDDEALAAFRAAEPFPNPPKALVDKQTGEISFRFGFLFEINRRPAFRIFRNN